MHIANAALALFLALLSFVPTFAADSYPSRPIRIVVPWPAGGLADVRVRQMAIKLERALDQKVLVDNKPGASGMIGADIVAKSAPDGHTLLFGSINELAIAPAVNSKLSYDPLKDFAPITLGAITPLVIVAHPASGPRSIKDLIAQAKAKPGEVNYGSAGNATNQHFAGELLRDAAGIDITHIPYKGAAPMLTDVVAGQIPLGFDFPITSAPFIKSGRLAGLAVMGPRRVKILPDVPTLREAGVAGVEMASWGGYLAPAGTPKPVIDRLYAEISRAYRLPDVEDSFISGGSEIVVNTPEQFAAFMKAEAAKWAQIVKRSGIRLD